MTHRSLGRLAVSPLLLLVVSVACQRPAEPAGGGGDPSGAGDVAPEVVPDAAARTGVSVPAVRGLSTVVADASKVAAAASPAAPASAGADPGADGSAVASVRVEPLPAAAAGSAPDETWLSEKMERRIRNRLRKAHRATVRLPAKVVLPEADGGVTVLALFEYSQMERCVSDKGGGKEARRACLAEARPFSGAPIEDLTRCTRRGLVRVRFGPPKPANPGYGGALEVVASTLVEFRHEPNVAQGCMIETVNRFALEDSDADGQQELVVELLTRTPDNTFRAPTRFDYQHRTIGWFREDLTAQYVDHLGSWGYEGFAGTAVLLRRLTPGDTNNDGHPDLEVEELDVQDWMCPDGPTGWPDDPTDCGEDLEIDRAVLIYDAAEDTWR